MERWFVFSFGNQVHYAKGVSEVEAATKLGICLGALRALDYSKEVHEVPIEYKEIIFTFLDKKRVPISNETVFGKQIVEHVLNGEEKFVIHIGGKTFNCVARIEPFEIDITEVKGGSEMIFDLSFEEAIDILNSKIGWVQGEKFDKHEYLALDRTRNVIIKNTVDDGQIGCVFPFYGNQTKEAWYTISAMPNEMKTQKYRFISVLNRDSVKGVGGYAKGNNRNDYLLYKSLHKRKL